MISQSGKNVLLTCSQNISCRFWFVHGHPTWIQLSGAEIKSQFGEMAGIDEKGWTAIWRLLRMLETKMYRGSVLRWREIFPPELAVSWKCYVRIVA
jgi:hypothetical protein